MKWLINLLRGRRAKESVTEIKAIASRYFVHDVTNTNIDNYHIVLTSRLVEPLAWDRRWIDWDYDESISQLLNHVVFGVCAVEGVEHEV